MSRFGNLSDKPKERMRRGHAEGAWGTQAEDAPSASVTSIIPPSRIGRKAIAA